MLWARSTLATTEQDTEKDKKSGLVTNSSSSACIYEPDVL